jgi:hypothetical protein
MRSFTFFKKLFLFPLPVVRQYFVQTFSSPLAVKFGILKVGLVAAASCRPVVLL